MVTLWALSSASIIDIIEKKIKYPRLFWFITNVLQQPSNLHYVGYHDLKFEGAEAFLNVDMY